MAPRKIKLKHKACCAKCGKSLSEGTLAQYDKDQPSKKKIVCVTCKFPVANSSANPPPKVVIDKKTPAVPGPENTDSEELYSLMDRIMQIGPREDALGGRLVYIPAVRNRKYVPDTESPLITLWDRYAFELAKHVLQGHPDQWAGPKECAAKIGALVDALIERRSRK
jgi:hypothetical protein